MKIEVFTHWDPVVQIRQVNFAIVVDEHADFDAHIGSWSNVTHRCIVGMGIHQPNANRNIVCAAFVGYWDSPLKIRQFLARTVVEN